MTDVISRRLTHTALPQGAVVEAVQTGDGVQLFYAPGTPAPNRDGTLNGVPVERIAQSDLDSAIAVADPELHLFKGLRCAIGLTNGEGPVITAEWLHHHAALGLEAAVILDRGQGDHLARALAQADLPDLKSVVVVTSDLPLGRIAGPEHHPYETPGAPGKDRMEPPPPDPWRAPLDYGPLWQALRLRFLDQAAAVLNLEICDLLRPGQSVWDRIQTEGCVTLAGRQVYPWRVRPKQSDIAAAAVDALLPGYPDAPPAARFADHICAPFDDSSHRRKWGTRPIPGTIWRAHRVAGALPDDSRPVMFDRHMALRHRAEAVGKIVPKSSLIEAPDLLERYGNDAPVRMPQMKPAPIPQGPARTTIVTCMKNEGPFILEWLAYHRAIGVTDVLVYTNDCTDGTDGLLDLLQTKGLVQHRDNPFRGTGLKPQHAALAASDSEPCVTQADWAISMDVDEFLNIKTGDGTLAALYAAVPDANLISCTWRLFGNGDVHRYDDTPLIDQFTRCAPEFANKPHQAWGFKTLFRRNGIFRKMGVHRPKGLNAQLWEQINWVNGSGQALPPKMYRNAWRSTSDTFGYDLVQLNHYAVRSAESFLVKRDRGRVNHVDRDQGLAYWFRMNNNAAQDRSIQTRAPLMRAELARLMADPDIAAAHAACVHAHRTKIAQLRDRGDQAVFYATLCSPRMERLSRLHRHFGANVFLEGPGVVPDDVAFGELAADFTFTVPRRGETQH